MTNLPSLNSFKAFLVSGSAGLARGTVVLEATWAHDLVAGLSKACALIEKELINFSSNLMTLR